MALEPRRLREIFAYGMTGIAALFPKKMQCFAYYNTTDTASILQAVDDLSAYVEAEGPFDGVMGFSQGAALAAMLLVRASSSPPFSFAIFICAGVPFSENSLRLGVLRYLDPESVGEVIQVPTANIVGARDADLFAAMAMMRLCTSQGRRLFDHGAGHEVPVNPREVTGNMARCIEDVIAKATLVQ
jgi:hypothetical protein